MSLTVSEKSGPSAPPIPAGTYLAICCMMVDLGLQYNEKFGNTSPKVLIGWEVPSETIEIDGEEKPRLVSKQYTASLSAKATLRKDLESWRGKAFTPEELKAFDMKSIVGTSCMLSIIHQESTTGKTYAKISGVMAVPKGMPRAALSEPAITLDLDTCDLSEVQNLPNWISDMIMKSETYRNRLSDPPQIIELPDDPDSESDLPF